MENSFQLTPEDASSATQWLLCWDDAAFVLKNHQGAVVLESETVKAHRLVDVADLYIEDKVSLLKDEKLITFKVHRAAGRAVRELVNRGLRTDDEYRMEQKQAARSRIHTGVLGFGGLFVLYCWIVVALDDKHVSPPGWLKALGGFIHLLGIVFLASGLAGFVVVWYSVRHSLRIVRIERALDPS